MRSGSVYPGDGPPSVSAGLTNELLAYEAHKVDECADKGLGIDGMPLQRGQSPLTRTKKNEPGDYASRPDDRAAEEGLGRDQDGSGDAAPVLPGAGSDAGHRLSGMEEHRPC